MLVQIIEHGPAHGLQWSQSVIILTSNVGASKAAQIAKDRSQVCPLLYSPAARRLQCTRQGGPALTPRCSPACTDRPSTPWWPWQSTHGCTGGFDAVQDDRAWPEHEVQRMVEDSWRLQCRADDEDQQVDGMVGQARMIKLVRCRVVSQACACCRRLSAGRMR